MYAAKTSKFESLKMCKLIAIYYGQKIISILALPNFKHFRTFKDSNICNACFKSIYWH